VARSGRTRPAEHLLWHGIPQIVAATTPPRQPVVISSSEPRQIVRKRTDATIVYPANLGLRPAALAFGGKRNIFEGGTPGATITTGNSGGASLDAFGAVNGNVTYTNEQTRQAVSAKIFEPNGGTAITSVVHFSLGSLVVATYGRVYIYLTALPTAAIQVIRITTNAGSASAIIRIGITGRFSVCDASNTSIVSGVNVLPLNQWVRCEWRTIASTTVGELELRYWTSPESTGTPTETLNGTSMVLGANSDRAGYGITVVPGAFTADYTMYLDDIVSGAQGWPGPSGTPTNSVTSQPLTVFNVGAGVRTAEANAHRRALVVPPSLVQRAAASAPAAPVLPPRAQPQTVQRSDDRRRVKVRGAVYSSRPQALAVPPAGAVTPVYPITVQRLLRRVAPRPLPSLNSYQVQRAAASLALEALVTPPRPPATVQATPARPSRRPRGLVWAPRPPLAASQGFAPPTTPPRTTYTILSQVAPRQRRQGRVWAPYPPLAATQTPPVTLPPRTTYTVARPQPPKQPRQGHVIQTRAVAAYVPITRPPSGVVQRAPQPMQNRTRPGRVVVSRPKYTPPIITRPPSIIVRPEPYRRRPGHVWQIRSLGLLVPPPPTPWPPTTPTGGITGASRTAGTGSQGVRDGTMGTATRDIASGDNKTDAVTADGRTDGG